MRKGRAQNMTFNSIEFLIFFPIVVLVFFVVPRKLRYIWLLIASYYFYMCWNPQYALLIAASTLITYTSSILIEKTENTAWKKIWVAGSLLSNLGILAVFKYADFFLVNLNKIFTWMGLEIVNRKVDLLLPVGISFYTFQALSYTLDVYHGTIKAEKNVLKYALFVSFFPQLVAGPIERSNNLLTQIQGIEKIEVWDSDRIKDGLILMEWGLFQKIVIADRASLLVNTVINNYKNYGILQISLAMFLFAFQIYCDFDGYTNIARGSARVMGFALMDNFRQPYLAGNIKDFWRRWHISLTTWFTDYLYIPLGGNRKGVLRKYINILLIFGVSGLWHGASWNYVAWGLCHAFYQIVSDIRQKVFGIPASHTFSSNLREIIGTFVLVDFAWIFFVANDFHHALGIIKQCFSFSAESIYNLGLSKDNLNFLLLSIAVLVTVDIFHEKGVSIWSGIKQQEWWFRWLFYVSFAWTIIMFGIYGASYDTSTFIYFQF